MSMISKDMDFSIQHDFLLQSATDPSKVFLLAGSASGLRVGLPPVSAGSESHEAEVFRPGPRKPREWERCRTAITT
jgi:hypothetical protein